MQISKIRGAIFDVDDTLLDNYASDKFASIHEHSRLAAAQEAGRRHGIKKLEHMTMEQCVRAFHEAKYHTIYYAVWKMLEMADEVVTDEVEMDHLLLKEIIELKEAQHEIRLRKEGREIPGSTAFVRALAAYPGLRGKLAVASTANRRDVLVYFEMSGLDKVFKPENIVTREQFVKAKPDPEPFNLAFARLGLQEADRPFTVAFEDDPRGIMSAKAAGLYTIAICSRFKRTDLQKLAVPADFTAETYTEIAAHLGM